MLIIIFFHLISGAGGGQSISQQQRTNSSVHVCWHRSTTVPVAEYHRSLRNLLSGYLLRKFKSSNGWQKLWVIFTNSCLFFFKTFEDDCPLASLPLLGYSVSSCVLESKYHSSRGRVPSFVTQSFVRLFVTKIQIL